MSLLFRVAMPEDSQVVARLIVQAMDDLALKFVNSDKVSDAISVFEMFVQMKGNLYSYENVIVCEDEGVIVGSINGYDGGRYKALRDPFLNYTRSNFSFSADIEDETSQGEFYLDTVSVLPGKQGQGIGSLLIKAMIKYAIDRGHTRVALLVDKKNPKAKNLYEQIGFKWTNDKMFLGGTYEHLIFDGSK